MARVSTTEGGFGGGASIIHTDSSHSEYVSVPDADLLFRGDYHRAGPDLVLTGHDGRHHIVPGYFASEKHAALVAPNGASLSADVVDLLAGSPAPGQYAQAQPTTPPDSIGKVEKVVGDVTVVRNGVSVALHVGDAVFKSDVIVTGGDSSAGITFPDGTVLDLVANSRMALNEYSFEPNGANNGAVFTLVEGTFGFVAGQVAQDNHMSVVTPVATMGIRGTAGIVRHEFRANAGDLIYSFLVLDEVDIRRHGHHVGAYEVRDNRPDSPTFGEILQLFADSGYVTSIELQGSGLPPIVTTEAITNSRLSDDRLILQDLVDSYSQFNGPGGIHSPGSGDAPNLLFGPQFLPENGGGNPVNFIGVPPTGDTNIKVTTTSITTPPPEAPSPPVISVPAPSQTLVINTAGAISGVSVAETNSTSGETFTVTLSDNNGVLSANTSATGGGGTITSTNSGHTLTIVGTLSEVNADLASLKDTDTTPGPDTITVTATDSLGHAAAPQTIAVTVAGLPVIGVTTPTQTIGVGETDSIVGVSVSESGATTGEIFTVTLQDSNGVLSATDTGGTGNTVSSPGTTLTISGTLSEVNADLATLKDTDTTATPTDTPEIITLNASDGFDNIATSQTIAVTVAGLPVIGVTTPTQTIGVGQTDSIVGVSVSESGATTGEIFTVTLQDSNGVLSATDTGGTGNTVSSPGTTLTISGTLSEVNADLATLKDTDTTATPTDTPEIITLNASDGFDNIATSQTIAVTVAGLPVIGVTTPTQTIGVGQTDSIVGVSVSESGATTGEIFTVTLQDSNGVLSATDTGGTGNTVSSPGTTLTISGTLSEVNADLATLKDTDTTATPTDTPEIITLNASDGFDNIATSQTIAVTVAGLPVIGVTTPTQTIGVGQTDSIVGVSVSESGATTGEIFTVTLQDSNGVLSATDTGGTGNTVSSPGTTLTISGTLSEVNADLATLKDTDTTATPTDTPEIITLNASDGFDNIATSQTIAVTVAGLPVIGVTTPTQTIGVGQTDSIVGVSVSESGATTGEIFTVTLQDSNGVLSATDTGGTGNTVSSPGTTLTISGTLSEVNADLATLKDTDTTATPTDTPEIITLNASDGFDNIATSQTIAVTVAGLPVIGVTTPTQTIGVGQTDSIVGVSVSESGATTGEIFTVTLQDSNGVLSATDTGGTGNTVSSPGTTLTISGTLSEVNADLATLKDTDTTATPTETPEIITLNASDGFDNIATSQTIAVTVAGLPVIGVTTPTQTIGVGETDSIVGVSVSESGATTGEIFTVTLQDSNGVLSATDTGGTGNTVSSPGTTLTISGTLSEVNADLATLKDTDTTATPTDTPEIITLNASDGFDNIATSQTIAVTVAGLPVIGVTTPTQTIGVGQTDSIVGVSVSESGATTGEIFTVTLQDSNGVLSATDTGGTGNTVSSPGTTLTISGTLSEVNADLATLKDTDTTATPTDTPEIITLNASDGFDNIATSQTIAVTVAGLPVIGVTTPTQTIGVGQTDSIVGVSVSESGATTGEIFTVTLQDSNGVLSATDTGGTGNTVSSPGTTLTISGTLSEVNADLATLKDTDTTATPTETPEIITLNASDGFDNIATSQTIAVTVAGLPVIGVTTPTQTIGVGQTDSIVGVSVSESGATTGEIFTVTLQDSNGVLSATDTGGTGNTVSSPGTTLTISGTLSEVNADLATLKDTDTTATPTETPEIITLNASDGFDNIATSQTIAVTVAGLPVIGVTTPTQTIGVGQTDSIVGVSVSESGATTGEIFTVTLQDSNGVLSATDTGGTGNTVSSPGTTLTISGTLSEVNADLATLKDTDTTATPTETPEIITLNASDGFDNIATSQTIAVTVAGLPVIGVTTPTQTIGVGQTDSIVGVSVSESGATTGEIFTVTLQDSNGVLSATDTGGTGNTVSSPGTTLTISGTLSEVNADLATLKDTDTTATPTETPEIITLNASDGFDNIATSQTIAVTVAGLPVIGVTTPTQTIGVGQTDSIVGVSVSESGATTGEIFTVTLQDSNGVLSATDTGGTGNTVSSPGTTLTISGTLSEVNADLATLKDTDTTATPTETPEIITLNASDGFDNIATSQTIAVTVAGLPVIGVTTPTQTIGVGQTDSIVGVSVSESGATTGEIFTVTLQDSNGVLSATDTGGTGNTVSSPGTTLTISGTLSEVNADLATLKDTDTTATPTETPEIITLNASDGFDNIATSQTIAVTVAGLPVIGVTTPTQTIGVGQTDSIVGVSVSESGATTGEIFTVTLQDSNGVLSATDTGGTGNTVSSPGTTLTISGTLSEVNADLATLKDTDTTATPTETPEIITLNASDGFDNIATSQTIAVTVAGLPVIGVTTPTQTIGVGQTDSIVGVSVSESGATTGEIFTVTLQDSNGVLSATDTGGTGNTVSSPGTTLTISGTLSEVNADLATLKDTDTTATPTETPEIITLNASDGFDNIATSQTIAVTVAGLPVIGVTTPTQTIGVGQTDSIVGVSVSESGATTGEIFTVTLQDSNGVLSATDTGGTGNTVSSPGTTLTISGTLSEVNADLATLKDTDTTATPTDTPEIITLNASDGFDNIATSQTIAVTVAGLPVIGVTTPTQTIGVGQTDSIVGVSVSESGATTGEIFTVTLQDSNGVLSATDTGGTGNTVSSPGTTLTISGTLSEVNADLATLKDTDTTATPTETPEIITLNASDGFDNIATSQTIAVTVAGLPVIGVTTPTQTIGVGQTDSIVGVSVSESGATTGEIFTVTLQDSNGVLSATDTGGTGNTVSSPGTTLTISGTLSEVNADLATLKDTDTTAGFDNITVTATDSFGNSATPATIVVTVPALDSFSGGTVNYSNNDHIAYSGPQISSDGSTLTLTNDNIGEYGSWFSKNTYSIDSFTASFDYQASGLADGMAFILQDDPRGSSALGTNFAGNGGSGLGYDGISPSAAVEFNIWHGHVQGTNFATDGSTGNYNSTGSVAFWNGDEIHVLLTYNGSVLTETLTDLVNGATYSASYTVNLAQVLGSDIAYVGFSGGTGVYASTQTISNFTFEPGTVSSPAGVAGSPINLALTDPSGGQATGPITLTFTGVPSGWSLNQGTNLGNGTWTVETNDLSALTVMTAAAYTGAIVLGVTETWTNANGSTGTATVADNVEAYAPGAPIFALSGNDTLTGAGGNNDFVFAQPIGNDTIYNFNVATDKVDLIGFANVASFNDIKGNIADDGHGGTVITIGAGETITLQGINAASLTAADFVFNQTPVVENAGNMVVSDGAVLPLGGTIDNTGAIVLNSSGDHTELQIIGNGVTLEGGGQLTLSDSSANAIVGTGPNDTLTNVDNTISGAGQIGSGDGTLTLVNEAHGTIAANDAGGTLTLETGTTITNNGVLEALNGGTLQILDQVTGSGSAIIAGGTMIFGAQSNMNVTFNNGPNGTTYGDLVLGDASGFSGQISGFTGNAPDPAHSDAIDLVGINYNSSAFSEAYNASNGLLTVTDGTHAASFTFDNFNGTLSFASDGNGGTLITDPAATGGSNTSVSVGGPGNDTFVFQPGIGAETIGNFNPWADTLELDHFANVQNIQQLAALIGTDAHGDAVIELGHNDSVTLPGVTQSYLQAHLQSLVHLG